MRRQVGWLVCLALLVGACAADPTTAPGGQDTVAGTEFPTSTTGAGDDTLSNTDRPTSTTGAAGVVGLFASALVEFDSCAAFIDHVKAEALERVGPYGLDGDLRVGIMEEMMMEAAAADSAEAAAPAATSAPQAGVDYSTTNIQEIGVDEPDIVKTDGNRILVLADGTLHYVDVSSGSPELVGTLDMWSSWSWQDRDDHYWNHEMFLGIDTALLIAGGYGDRGDLTQVVHVDLSDPENLTAGDTLTVEGRYVSARLVGDRVSVVLSSRPHERIEFVYPQSEAGENRAEQANRQAIIESTIEDWAPGYVLDSTGGNAEGLFIDCGSAYAPEEFSGFDFLSVFSFDMAGGIDHRGVSTVMSGGDTVYASTTNLYVATERWVDWIALEEDDAVREAETTTTHIHQFDISGPDGAEYLASGSVDGFLLNQFAMSEHQGFLRVASTDAPAWGWWVQQDRPSVSRVDVLERDGRELRIVGSVGGLGRDERIFAVRFMGEVGYIVTFRQTDPLYTVDLSDPRNPRVMGELKILGYSAYLHPIGDGLLLGIGQDADEQGRTQGTQLSVFDVSDLSNPTRIHQLTLPEWSDSEVEWDHRAFLYWAPDEIAVMPVSWWKYDEEWDISEQFSGAIVFSVGGGGIRQLATVEHDVEDSLSQQQIDYWPSLPIRRSLVVGETLFTVSEGGLMGSDLRTFEPASWIGFRLPDGYGIPEPLEF